MKYSILTSVAITLLAFIPNAKAQVTPELSPATPKTYAECLQKGGTSSACHTLFASIKTCAEENSMDEPDWKDCVAAAEATFHLSLTGGREIEPYAGEIKDVQTNAANAQYYELDMEHKGYRNAQQ